MESIYDDNDIVIVKALRTPIGSFNGGLSSLPAHQLASVVIKEIIKQENITSNEIDQVILGQVLTAGCGQNPARQAVLHAGLSNEIPALTINQVCGSGLRAVCLAYFELLSSSSFNSSAKFILAGGQESMSQAPLVMPSSLRSTGFRMGDITVVDSMIHDGLTDAMHNIHMGKTAENVAKKFSISREEQDNFAFSSQFKYKTATSTAVPSFYNEEIVPVEIASRSGTIVISSDEHPRPSTTVDSLAKLRPAFVVTSEEGSVTAGNASGINDGAAIVLMAKFGNLSLEQKLKTFAKIVSWAQVGCDPLVMGLGPINAIHKALERANWNKETVDIWELNEAFASQSIAVIRELNIDVNKVNIGGGSIALGHPIGASGCRILVTLVHHMKRNNFKRGVAALCIGGGMGIAMCVQRSTEKENV